MTNQEKQKLKNKEGMMKAQLCPICNGSGKIHEPPNRESASSVGNYRTCHGCGGLGWVSVPEDHITYYPVEDMKDIKLRLE